uniref:Sensor histidine kinase NatK-like C-terminal domain-containing protein n=1 Tax=Eubacterium plexicaudatum ASF492 TaxID=1235802 RepID=N2BHG0_9FIRM
MLGGSFWIALLRNAISTGLMLSFFFMLDRPRFSMKKTAWCYIIFGVSMVTAYSVWYLAAKSSFVRFAALSALPAVGIFCSIMSSEVLYLSLYKMALAFYLFSVCTFCGVDVTRWWFEGNLWIDILVRFVCFVLILIFTWFKFRKQFLGGVDFLLQEMDLFSAAALFVSVMLGAIMAYWPNLQGFSVFNMVRAFLILFMAGTLQYAILHLYIHLGQEHYYQAEKELLEVNEQLLHQQMDLMRESKIEAARIRHDVRHHTLLIREYVQKKEYDQLLAYLTQYDEDVEKWKVKDISNNLAVNGILLAYAKKARRQNIQVVMDIRLEENLPIRDIDWIAILANMFENAIHGCAGSGQPQQVIDIYISQKKNKVVIRCQNTSSKEVVFRKGLPQSDKGEGMGVASIIKAVSRYEGATDFCVRDGMFITRILLNLT